MPNITVRHWLLVFPKVTLRIALACSLSSPAAAQKDTGTHRLSPLFMSVYKKPVKPSAELNARFKTPTNQLMFWPNYPLTYAQIEARNREWDREYGRPIGEQIASDIIKSYVNTLIYGKPYTPAKIPKF